MHKYMVNGAIIAQKSKFVAKQAIVSLSLFSILAPYASIAAPPRNPDKTVNCDMLVVGGGLSGAATAYEGLLAGRTVCLTEITDWLGGANLRTGDIRIR